MLIVCFIILFLLFSLGNVYIADWGNNRIRKVTALTGVISTIAGTGESSFSGDGGEATSATLFNPTGVVLDSSGRRIFFLLSFDSLPCSILY